MANINGHYGGGYLSAACTPGLNKWKPRADSQHNRP